MPATIIIVAQSATPTVTLVLLGVFVFIGVLLLILGRTLAKPACSITGLMMGAFVGFTLGQIFGVGGTMTSVIVMGAAATGSLLATMLFRLWVTLTGTILMALVVPAVALVWQGTTAPPDLSALDTDQVMESQEEIQAIVDSDNTDEATSVAGGLVQSLQAIYTRQSNEICNWLQARTGKERMFLITGAIVGAVMGLIFGLFRPLLAASVQSALVGSFFICIPGRELLEHFLPSLVSWLPNTPRWMLILMGLITTMGILIQWIMAGDEADK